MTEQSKFYSALSDIRQKSMSGKLHAYYKDELSLRYLTIHFSEGEIIKFDGADIKEASDLLSLSIIMTIFIQRSPENSQERVPGTLSLEEILVRMDSSDAQRTSPDIEVQPVSVDSGGQLQKEVAFMLGSLFGPSIIPKVESIAKKFPPDSEPKDYLNQCKKLFEVMLGRSKAIEVFNPLYERYT